ncbi:NCS cytosine-purine permease [Exidia glandulosa HHB12029]|uniref:NCS cytosine-purine permease n=1 Tax=Exidia glandulosa HHB12029 TaxID=1314781 RepID=A0A165CGL0_EXIGL|nr:NCS cytosine-purine permease [Exidia glandulosa HHB12029]
MSQSRHSIEKDKDVRVDDESLDLQEKGGLPPESQFQHLSRRLLTLGVETRGILPVSVEDRSDPEFRKVFFLWLSANCNILSISAGTLGPLVFGLSFRDTALCILGFNIIGCALPAYFSTFGPKLGLRQMVHARYSFGFFGAILPAFLNLATMMGYLILSCILGGSTLSSASVSFDPTVGERAGGISWDVGIVIVAIISLFVSFCGYRVLNVYERFAFIPVFIVFLIATGVGGKHLSPDNSLPPATAPQILSFGATVAGFVISYCPLSSDFTTYMRPDVSSYKVFFYTYFGFMTPIVLVQTLGAAFAASLTANPSWALAYETTSLSGLLHAILHPAGDKFARFLLVILAFSVSANVSPTLYSFGLSLQVVFPFRATLRIPRYILSAVAVAILIPLAIVAATHFEEALSNFLGLIGYWSAIFGSVVFTEHIVFRRGVFSRYNVGFWDLSHALPPGLAALASCAVGIAFVVLCMEEAWFTGPIAKHTGDIAFELGFAATALTYIPLRAIERRIAGR